MPEEANFSFIPPLVEQHYAVKVSGPPELLHEREGQRVFYVPIAEGSALTLRLCTVYRTHEKVLADTGALLFLNHAWFSAPVLRMTVEDERCFQWQPGCWGYAQDFIPGENPFMDLPTLTELGHLLGRMHNLASTPDQYPVEVGWLDELPDALLKAEAATKDEEWGKKAAEVAENLRGLPDLSQLPLGLIHTDVHEGNLLRTPDGRLVMLDWEDAGLGQAIFDVALVLGWNCVWQSTTGLFKKNGPPELYDFDEEYCRTLLGAYQAERPLSELEMQLLGPSIRFVMGWFAARDIKREIIEPGVSEGLAFTNWAIMRSVTPAWAEQLAGWAAETRPQPPELQ